MISYPQSQMTCFCLIFKTKAYIRMPSIFKDIFSRDLAANIGPYVGPTVRQKNSKKSFCHCCHRHRCRCHRRRPRCPRCPRCHRRRHRRHRHPGSSTNEEEDPVSSEASVMNDNHNIDVKAARETLQCPVCTEMMKPPTRIWMCSSSHIICEPCKNKLDDNRFVLHLCPTCRTSPVSLRSFLAENFAECVFNKKQ